MKSPEKCGKTELYQEACRLGPDFQALCPVETGRLAPGLQTRKPSPMLSDMKRKTYEEALRALQTRLVAMARWAKHRNERIAILLEGRDTAGKSGTIHAITHVLNPRQTHVVALPTPSERERQQWYFQRYVPHLPAAGEIVLFDRSWYNRAGVEHVMGFCTPEQYTAFLHQAPQFERLLVDDGLRLFKYWLSVDQDEQEQRFAERAADPLKRWKLSPVDLEARRKYAEYGLARDAMLAATHTPFAPWTLIDYNDQHRGRLTLIADLLRRLNIPADEETAIDLPALPQPALKENFTGPLRPIASWANDMDTPDPDSTAHHGNGKNGKKHKHGKPSD